MLLYLDKSNKSGVWYYPACTRSSWTKEGIADIKYIENLNECSWKNSFIWNGLSRYTYSNQYSNYQPLPNRSIQISGNGKNIEVKTDENGFYEIYDLPAGKYKINVENIEGYKLGWLDKIESFDVAIKPKSHTEQNIIYGIEN